MKIPQTPYMKNLDKIEVLSKAESNFLKVIVRPLWSVMNNFLGDELSEQIQMLNDNIIEWEKISNNFNVLEKKKTTLLKVVPLDKETKETENKEKETPYSLTNGDSGLNTPALPMNSSTTVDELAILSAQRKKSRNLKKLEELMTAVGSGLTVILKVI